MVELSGLNLNLLVALDALLQEGSVTRAGRRIGLSTPAMSHALSRLRAQLQDPLLVRAGATLVLTARADELKARVAKHLPPSVSGSPSISSWRWSTCKSPPAPATPASSMTL